MLASVGRFLMKGFQAFIFILFRSLLITLFHVFKVLQLIDPPLSSIHFRTPNHHCMKSVRIRSYSGPHFSIFGLKTERYSVSLRIQSEYGKMQTRITPNTNTFYEVHCILLSCKHSLISINFSLILISSTEVLSSGQVLQIHLTILVYFFSSLITSSLLTG